jgi:hypothetical protein
MPQFLNEISFAGVVLFFGQICTVLIIVWNRSKVETEQRGKIDSNTARIERLEIGTKAQTDQLETEVDARFAKTEMETSAKVAALQGSINLMRDQHHELREHLATSYMKREEILQMERRVVDGQTNIMARIDKFETRLDTMQKAILDAITSERRSRQ